MTVVTMTSTLFLHLPSTNWKNV